MNHLIVRKLIIDGHVTGVLSGRPTDFITYFTLQIVGDVDGKSEEALGSIGLYKISILAARQCNRSLKQICEEYSESLASMFHCVFDERERTRQDLMITPWWRDLQVFWDLDIDSKYRTQSVVVTAMERTIMAIGSTDLVVAEMQNDVVGGLDLTVDECMELGFLRIDKGHFAVRDSVKLSKAFLADKSET
jgi:hypothetical protein